jgi:hypothetical protein
MDSLETEPGRRVVLALTDGLDLAITPKLKAGLAEVLESLRR